MSKAGAVFLCLLLAAPADAAQDPDIEWTQHGRCGTNSLFVLLSLLNSRVNYKDLASRLPVEGTQGTSLQDLADAATADGVNVAIRRIPTDEVVNIQPPFIMHLELADRGASGHYITVYAIDRHNEGADVLYIDGGSGMATRMNFASLRPLSTGFVLMPADRQAQPMQSLMSLTLYSAAGACLVVILLACWMRLRT
ncbi:MAG: cysteine peptidase family C39 domain-containing protein [Planctomycetaceae bacterium]